MIILTLRDDFSTTYNLIPTYILIYNTHFLSWLETTPSDLRARSLTYTKLIATFFLQTLCA